MPPSGRDENLQKQVPGDSGVKGPDETAEEKTTAASMIDAKPTGEVVDTTNDGEESTLHYRSFEFAGVEYHLDDFVYLAPEVDENGIPVRRPDVAIIKDITQVPDGELWITRQWLYRPEKAKKDGGGRFKSSDNREIYHSCRKDVVPANAIMHKCKVHYIPSYQAPPLRSEYPGLFVQKMYDMNAKCLYEIDDSGFPDEVSQEIKLLLEKTHEYLGDYDIGETDECLRGLAIGNQKVDLKEDYDDTPAEVIIAKFKAATGSQQREWGLEKLLEGVEPICKFKNRSEVDKSPSYPVCDDKGDMIFSSAKDAISTVASLEKVAYDSLGSKMLIYKQKILSLEYNLKHNARLARRFLKKELKASVILNMTPVELKDGLTAEEKKSQEPEKSKPMEMTDARCKNCNERAGIVDVIKAGRMDRYQLECSSCGYQWYASHDAIYSLTVDASTVGNVGTAPWATAKFEDVQKQRSPHEKPSPNIFQKKTAAYIPTSKVQKSFKGKGKANEGNPTAE